MTSAEVTFTTRVLLRPFEVDEPLAVVLSATCDVCGFMIRNSDFDEVERHARVHIDGRATVDEVGRR